MAFVVFMVIHLFLLWIAYDIGCDVGYNRSWQERHPDPSAAEVARRLAAHPRPTDDRRP